MLTIIIVLLIVALVVAIVLKKRSGNQNTATPKKGATGKSTKKAATTKTSRTTLAREEQESAPPTTTAISDALRQKIEQQIQNGQYQSVEAQINQILKQDNSQHELYLFLLDIHLAQKDDFAIDQLIKYIHALKLEDIAHAAEAKQREYEKNKQPNTTGFNSFSNHFHQPSAPATQQNTADFDALTPSATSQSFDDLQSNHVAPAEEVKAVEPVTEVQPLDFNFSFEKKESVEAAPATIEPQESKEPAPLEFSFNLDSAPAVPVVEEAKPELDFNLSNLELTEQKTEAAPTLDFNFESKAEKQVEVTETATESFVQVESIEASAETVSVASHDPLVQSFPDLQQLDEAELNLDLVEQYIELGAYESARELLKSSQTLLNAEQQQRSQNLLNQIAS